MNTLPVNYVELETIFHSLEKGGYRSISLSGAHNECGTSMTAYALAKRYQANGYRVLMVDLNIHHPSLNTQLGIARQEWNAGQSNQTAIYAPTETGTHFLAAPIANTASLSFRDPELIRKSIDTWLETYDRVVMDTTPISTHNYRDIPTNLICAAADASLLMIKSEQTTQMVLQECCEKLSKANANLAGIVMNDVAFPSLADEMIRETERIPNYIPWVKQALQRIIRSSTLLNFRA